MWPGWRRCVTRGGPWGFRNSWHSQLALSFCLRVAVSTRMFLVSALPPCLHAYCHLLHRNGQGLTLWNWKQAPKLSALFYMFLRLCFFFFCHSNRKETMVSYFFFELVFKLAFQFFNSNIFFVFCGLPWSLEAYIGASFMTEYLILTGFYHIDQLEVSELVFASIMNTWYWFMFH